MTTLDLSTFQPIDPGVGPPNSAQGLVIDGSGDLWAGIWRGGLVQLRDGRPLRRWTPSDGLPPHQTARPKLALPDGGVLVLSDNRLFIATSAGIEQLPGSGFPSMLRLSSILAENDRLWIGGDGLHVRIGDCHRRRLCSQRR